MTNKEIANAFSLLAQLMELHGEEEFKIRSYNNAYRILRNEEQELGKMNLVELKGIKGVGDAIANKILELQKNGKIKILTEYLDKTPSGIVELLDIKGMGVKKVWLLWKELEIESPGELLYACNENRLKDLKGFGEKSQQNVKEQLEYFFQSLAKFRWASVEEDADNLLEDLQDVLGEENVMLTGQFRRLMPVVDMLEYVVETNEIDSLIESGLINGLEEKNKDVWEGKSEKGGIKIRLYRANKGLSAVRLLESTGSSVLAKNILKNETPSTVLGLSEAELFEKAGIPFIPAEIRDIPNIDKKKVPDLIKSSDIKGVLHAHSTYSDGGASLKEMAEYCREQGYTYLGITDHSQSAFYANGLKPDRVIQQWNEIDSLNTKFTDFKIFKGIESDIKFEGDLDYDTEMLKGFDFVIASIHSNLKMTEGKATQRLIKAIENPYTTMLGHPTGRLLLSRAGYPVDHKKVIDACAKNAVIIEINANPLRLDLDYTWLEYALEKEVKIAINPDAHSKQGVHDIRYGIQVARKGLLTKENCVNCLSTDEFEKLISSKKSNQ